MLISKIFPCQPSILGTPFMEPPLYICIYIYIHTYNYIYTHHIYIIYHIFNIIYIIYHIYIYIYIYDISLYIIYPSCQWMVDPHRARGGLVDGLSCQWLDGNDFFFGRKNVDVQQPPR